MSHDTPSQGLETPSGKGRADENFPVGSFLIAKHLRPAVFAYYAFARATDDIADNPALSPDDKIVRLQAMRQAVETGEALEGTQTARRTRAELLAHGVPLRHAGDLTRAFEQDAVKQRYADWAELMEYCAYSAAPVGRFLLSLHGVGEEAAYRASDALCASLQVLNHVQDCGKDRAELDRVYLPQDMMDEAGASLFDLDKPASSPGLRRVLDRCLDGCEALNKQADPLPGFIHDKRFAAEAATILALAHRLTTRLRRGDPLAERVALTKLDFAFSFTRGVMSALRLRQAGRGEKRGEEAKEAA